MQTLPRGDWGVYVGAAQSQPRERQLTIDKELTGRRALITGAGRGIGRAIAEELARAGADVAIAARSTDQVGHVVADLTASGAHALGIPFDVSDPAAVQAAVASIEKQWGGIDILVNNAGVLGPIGRTDTNDVEAWLDTIRINLGGCFLCTHACLPGMIQRGAGGRIINLSGGGAVGPRPNFSAYGASKAAVVRFTETLAAEVADTGIQVNAIAPGAVNTTMTEMTAAAGEAAGDEAALAAQQLQVGGVDPARPAQLARFLASARSDGITGRLFHAVGDDWEAIQAEDLQDDDYTVRRMKPST